MVVDAAGVVIDANVVAALVLPLPYSEAARQRVIAWKQDGVAIQAPVLLHYEVSTVLRKAVVAGLISDLIAEQAIEHFVALGIEVQAPTKSLHQRALHWAAKLGQSKSYDGHYLALAEEIGAELWTADRRLAKSVRQVGGMMVREISEQ